MLLRWLGIKKIRKKASGDLTLIIEVIKVVEVDAIINFAVDVVVIMVIVVLDMVLVVVVVVSTELILTWTRCMMQVVLKGPEVVGDNFNQGQHLVFLPHLP